MRTERQVAGAVIARLLERGLIRQQGTVAETVARVSEATSVPVRAIRDAWALPTYIAPADRECVGPAPTTLDEPAPVKAAVAAVKTRAVQHTAKYRRANPEPGKRRCARCEGVFPEGEFPFKNKAKTRRRSYCTGCWSERQRERYLSIERERALNSVGIVLTVIDDDNVAGLACAVCGQPIAAGDEVRMSGALTHTGCVA